jgi:hypothetical protein
MQLPQQRKCGGAIAPVTANQPSGISGMKEYSTYLESKKGV